MGPVLAVDCNDLGPLSSRVCLPVEAPLRIADRMAPSRLDLMLLGVAPVLQL